MKSKQRETVWKVFLVLLVLLGVLSISRNAAAALTINSVTLNGGSNVTVLPNATISVVVSETNTASSNWRGTQFSTTAGSSCIDTPDHNGNGTFSATFNITAPAANGTYNANFVAFSNNNCTGSNSQTFTVIGGIIVASAPIVATNNATSLTTTGALLNGSVSSNGASTTVTFDYGLTTGYGSTVTAAQSPLAAGATGSAVSAAVTGLSCGTLYHFRVKGVNSVGTANGGDLTFTTSTCPVPTVITNAASSLTTTGATLNGIVSSNGASTTVTFDYGTTTGYGSTITATQSPLVAGAINSAVSAAVTGLSCGTLYHFRAKGVNSGGTTNGGDLTFTTSTCPVPTVTTNGASSVTTTGATLNGTVSSNGASTTVTFDYGTTTGYGSTITATQSPLVAGATNSAVSAAVTGLSCGTLYHFRAKGVNSGGTTNGGDLTFTTSTCPVPTVTTNAVSFLTATGATLNGTVSSNGASTTVTFDYGTTTGYGSTITATQSPLVAGATNSAVSAAVTGLICNTLYHFRVKGVNSGGTANGGDLTFTTLTCPVPTVTTNAASALTTTGATLNGTVSSNGASTTVTFDYGTTTGYGSTITATQSPLVAGATNSAVSAAVTGLSCGTLYHFRVKGVNSGGTANGGDLTFTTLTCPAPTVTTNAASALTTTGATLNGMVSSNGASTTVTFDYGTTTGYGSTITATQSPLIAGATNSAVSAAVTGLSCNTLYHFRAKGVNSGGTTNGNDLTFTTSACPGPTVTTNAASSLTTTGATLNGTVSSNGSSTTVTFDYGLTTSYGSTVTATQSPLASGASGSAVSAAVTGLTCGTLYHFRAKGVNSGGTTNGSDLTFTTSACLAPTVITNAASSLTTTGATLNGTVSSNGTSTTVTFDYGLTTSYGSTVTATQSPLASSASGSAVSAAVTGLTCGALYHFRAKGVNSGGTTNGGDLTFTTSNCASCTQPTNTPAGVSLTCVCDNFGRTNLNPSPIFGGNWIVSTSDSTGILPSIVNPGYLRLTNNTNNNAKAATVPGIFPAAGNYISVEFQHYAYNGTGADGVAVTLSDYAIPAVPGAFGGSLGYAQKSNPGSDCTTTGGCPGFAGGWLGVAMDEYGNYQNPTEGRIGGPGFTAQSVGARGSGSGISGYPYLGGTTSLTPTIDNHTATTSSPGYYYQVIVDARNEPTSTAVAVNRNTGSGYTNLLNIPNVYTANPSQAHVPTNWQISFTGGTGGSTNIHEIGGLRVCAQYSAPPSGGTATNFSAIDEGFGTLPLAVQNYLSGHIYTKLVGIPFKLNIAALNNNQIQTAYVPSGGSKTVTVKLVDNSDSIGDPSKDCTLSCTTTCINKTAVTGGTQTLTYVYNDSGQKQSPNFTLNTAYQKLVAIISDGTLSDCSIDSFAVRPTGIATLTSANALNTATFGTPVFQAGSDHFALTATTVGVTGNPSGYTGVLKINNAGVQAVSPAVIAGAVTGTFPAATSAIPSSTATGSTFTYSEVGAFLFLGYNPAINTSSPRGVFDGVTTATECITAPQCDTLKTATWTGVDSISTRVDCVVDSYANTMDATGKYGCNFGLLQNTVGFGRFIPDHFALTRDDLANLPGGYLYNRADLATTGSISSNSNLLTVGSVVNIRTGETLTIKGADLAGATLSTIVSAVNTTTKVVTLANNAATTVTATNVYPDTFTYMDEPMMATFTLTAQNATNGTTRNYSGALAKLDFLTNPTLLGFGAFNNLNNPASNTSLTNRLTVLELTGIWPTDTINNGTTTISAKLTLPRLTASPWLDGPYENLDIGVVPRDSDGVTLLPTAFNRDMDNDVSHILDHQLLGSTKARFGRLWLGNAYGSDRTNLLIPYEFQYWNGNAFIRNADDKASSFSINPKNIGLVNYQLGITTANMSDAHLLAVTTDLCNNISCGGGGRITLTGPSTSATGSVDLVADLGTTSTTNTLSLDMRTDLTGASLRYLRARWYGNTLSCDTTWDCDPICRLTFGIFGQSTKKGGQIYLREYY